MASKQVVIGIDIGSADSIVAYVGKGVVDIIQNETSQRKTPTLVAFDDRERLLGDPALSKIKSNGKNTCRNFKQLLGRKPGDPCLEKEKEHSLCPLSTADDGFVGYEVTYKGDKRTFSAAKILSMYLFKLQEITEQWQKAKVAHAVISVPTYFTDEHRRAVLDACDIAGLECLRLMNDATATALSYGLYRSKDFAIDIPKYVAFCSAGHSCFSVTIVKFLQGALQVIGEYADQECGGRDMDNLLVKHFAREFQKKTGCDAYANIKARYKLEDGVTKTKKILSANSEAPLNIDSLMEDEDISGVISRDEFEEYCKPLFGKVENCMAKAMEMSGISKADLDCVEVVGGGSRVPWVKNLIQTFFEKEQLSFTLNADESVARGCALQAAMLSPHFKVSEFVVSDFAPNPIQIGWTVNADEAEMNINEDDGDADMTPPPASAASVNGMKTAVVFPAKSHYNTLKMLTFYRTGPFTITASYADPENLPAGVNPALGSYTIELPQGNENKKVKVRTKLSLHGVFSIDQAQVIEEEEYEETVREKREIPQEEKPVPNGEEQTEEQAGEGAEKADDGAAPAGDAEAKKEAKAPEPKFEWVPVTKRKVRTVKRDLKISAKGVPGIGKDVITTSRDEESAMQAETREIVETDNAKNDLESYIYNTRDKIGAGAWGEFMAADDKTAFLAKLDAMETWIYDTYDATKVQYIEKLQELKTLGDPVKFRVDEAENRAEAAANLNAVAAQYRLLAASQKEEYEHIALDKKQLIIADCDSTEAWLRETMGKQNALPKHAAVAITVKEIQNKQSELSKACDLILSEPKPAPPKQEEVPKDEAAPMETDEANAEMNAEQPTETAEEEPSNMDVDL